MARCLRRRAWLRPHRGRRDGRQPLILRKTHAAKTNSPNLRATLLVGISIGGTTRRQPLPQM